MKAPPFAYARARSLSEALQLLSDHGAGARVLAGGQSLVAALNLRLDSPEILVDIGRVPGLSGVTVAGQTVRIGALTTHAEIERSSEIARHLPLLRQAAPHIAHPAIRNVGTLGGSIVTADPAAEWPACCVALDATFVLASRDGSRRVRARDFFKGVYSTALRAGEILTSVEFDVAAPADRSAFLELARRRGDFAIVGVAAVAKRGERLSDVRLAYLGAGTTPLLARAAMSALEEGQGAPDAALEALARDLDPAGDMHSSAAAKLHLARVLTRRALALLNA